MYHLLYTTLPKVCGHQTSTRICACYMCILFENHWHLYGFWPIFADVTASTVEGFPLDFGKLEFVVFLVPEFYDDIMHQEGEIAQGLATKQFGNFFLKLSTSLLFLDPVTGIDFKMSKNLKKKICPVINISKDSTNITTFSLDLHFTYFPNIFVIYIF